MQELGSEWSHGFRPPVFFKVLFFYFPNNTYKKDGLNLALSYQTDNINFILCMCLYFHFDFLLLKACIYNLFMERHSKQKIKHVFLIFTS